MPNPIKPNLKTEIIPILLILVLGISSFYFYSYFPERVPIHWNFAGEPDNWGSPLFAAFMLPALISIMYLFFLFLPTVDPKKERYAQFHKIYHIFKTIIMFFMAVIYFVASLNALDYNIPIDVYIPLLIGLMFIIMGNYFSKIKPNWFIGIRTPWTLSSEYVWNKTHRFGGKIFMLGGLALMLVSLFPPIWRMVILFTTVIIIIFGTVGYSFLIYIKEKNK
ncbi:hypothetical protein A2331_05935 [Candidatus Falkowbacteria bacterium RIFOXYB2_FULL_34_18]|uniref:DUF1648 domain-containing protein n=1 Tax=Candidatus Falkowbacteria bacterium RIFOXYD2_FULL_34_120 TaxID=1798007 RepID=A0A1F5TPJ5_9BACT|nr:MAG: hypothetical protein A2331_05935 [Candidatus Falkowbacteria bacterium RIFOXYB2_FULL_34_18]OGF29072.1 MAG: hypothetical protein A2500_03460 [Candidatus Falkowbacteria bacterium RIFOXYC12_FULL_34_55]OGF36118.1 MAG: hypothetical protein A2466_03510 [Candidatus Falkowbacteria bacterium RIFOXYC2_FULL_34_220]OGF38570.1 MAG: hypothetical protein A2515_04770 [Candidatus Falkowbacteria bacterium RIFOXYD12_FULL_34_57]OGF40757.1 MAG: hypothetical protein A2531_06985 [Candidatus Falkowbacteria bact